jgi:hypothetical protein
MSSLNAIWFPVCRLFDGRADDGASHTNGWCVSHLPYPVKLCASLMHAFARSSSRDGLIGISH